MQERQTGTRIAEQLLTRSEGATMAELAAATGGPQYNLLKRLEGRGYVVRRIKEGNETRYFAEPPAQLVIDATVTSKGQMTIPVELRERLGVRAGGELRLALEGNDRIVMTPVDLSIRRLFGVLGKPKRSFTIEEMDETVRRAVADKKRPGRR